MLQYNSVEIFDTHAHLGLIKNDAISQLIIAKEASSQNIKAIINICNNLTDFENIYNNLHHAPNVYFAIGISPSEVINTHFKWDDKVEKLATQEKVIAIGETGLDRKFGNRDQQIEFFIRHIEIAERVRYPIIIHNRDAGKEICDILSEITISVPMILHCFSEDWEYAQKILAITQNVYFSFTGSLTYKAARKLREAASNIPIEHIIVESESPFMPPAEVNQKRNKPIYIKHTIEHLAHLKNHESTEELADILYQNSCRAFNITPS